MFLFGHQSNHEHRYNVGKTLTGPTIRYDVSRKSYNCTVQLPSTVGRGERNTGQENYLTYSLAYLTSPLAQGRSRITAIQ